MLRHGLNGQLLCLKNLVKICGIIIQQGRMHARSIPIYLNLFPDLSILSPGYIQFLKLSVLIRK